MKRFPRSWTTFKPYLSTPFTKRRCATPRFRPGSFMASLPGYINADDVVDLLKRKDPGTVVIDVRDDDFWGGHIKGAKQFPSGNFGAEESIDNLVESLPKDVNLIVVHCQLSQVRGPKCARRLSERLGSEKWRSRPQKPEIKVLRNGYEGFFDQVYNEHPELFQDVQQ